MLELADKYQKYVSANNTNNTLTILPAKTRKHTVGVTYLPEV